LQIRFAPRCSGQITSAFDLGWFESIYEDLFIKLFKSLAPGRAAGGCFFMHFDHRRHFLHLTGETMKLKKITSLTALFSFVVLTVSSIVLYVMPHGRVAYWADWHFWGLAKSDWDNMHINSGILFLVAACLHIFLNWTLILAYINNRSRDLKHFTGEFLGALVLTVAVVVGTYLMVPPFTYTLELSEALKDRGEVKYGNPPYGHAELSSIYILSKRMGLDPEICMMNLKKSGKKVTSVDQSLLEVAKENQTNPKEIYKVMSQGQKGRKSGHK